MLGDQSHNRDSLALGKYFGQAASGRGRSRLLDNLFLDL